MTQHGHLIRAVIVAVAGVKLLGLASFLAGPLTRNDPTLSGTGLTRTVLAAENEGEKKQAKRSSGRAAAVSPPVAMPGNEPSAVFTAKSNALRQFQEAMRRRSEELATREVEFTQREKALAAAAKDLEKKIERLESLGTKTAEEEEPAMEQLGKIYGAMKAEEAAPLLDRLDNESVRAIFRHMKQRQISAILPLMNRDKAVALTKLLGAKGRSRKGTGAGGG